MNPEKETSFYDLAVRMYTLVQSEKFDHAISELEERLKADPESLNVLVFFPYINYYKGSYDLAIEQGENLLGRTTSYPTVYLILAKSYLAKRKYSKVIPILDLALQRTPEDVDLLLEKAQFSTSMLRQHNKALELVETALSIEPNNPKLLTLKVQIYRLLKNEDATKILDQSLKIAPLHSKLHLEKGIISLSNNELEKAKEFSLEALKLNPKDEEAKAYLHSILGLIHFPKTFKLYRSLENNHIKRMIFFVLSFLICLAYTIFTKLLYGSGSWLLPLLIFAIYTSIQFFIICLKSFFFYSLSKNSKTNQYITDFTSKGDVIQNIFISTLIILLSLLILFYLLK